MIEKGKLYSGGEPEFIEGDVFRTIIPLNDVSVGVVEPKQDTIQDTVKDKTIKAIIEYCVVPRSRREIQQFIGHSNRGHFNKEYLTPLIKSGQLKMTIPQSPTSRNQKYIRT